MIEFAAASLNLSKVMADVMSKHPNANTSSVQSMCSLLSRAAGALASELEQRPDSLTHVDLNEMTCFVDVTPVAAELMCVMAASTADMRVRQAQLW
jgi:hypothetical protein